MSEVGFGGNILKDGNSMEFKTGSWKNKYPVHDSVGYCPENCIKQKDGILTDIDLDYCKGCGVCAKVCPFKAIEMKSKEN